MRPIQTSELLSSLYLIQRQIGASHNAYFKFYLSKKDGCIGNSVVCMCLSLNQHGGVHPNMCVCLWPMHNILPLKLNVIQVSVIVYRFVLFMKHKAPELPPLSGSG